MKKRTPQKAFCKNKNENLVKNKPRTREITDYFQQLSKR